MKRQPGLDLLRAVAIVWVMLFHSFIVGGLGPHFGWLSRFGWMGVDIFFVLSGYLIGTQVLAPLREGAPLAAGSFYRRRAYRILPAFLVVLALYAGFPWLREAPGMQSWWQFATFSMNLLADYPRLQAFSHAWSLCVEEHFYLVFPLLAWAMMRRPSAKAVVALAVFVVVAGVVLRGALWLHYSAQPTTTNWFIERIYFPTWTRLDGLLAGVLLAVLRVFRAQAWERMQPHANHMLAAGIVLWAIALGLFGNRVGLLANTLGWPVLALAVSLVVFAATNERSLIGRLRLPGAGWLASISYSLYLIHKIAFHLVQVSIAPVLEGHPWVTFMTYAASALVLGAALHYAVERPFLRLRDRRRVRGAVPLEVTA